MSRNVGACLLCSAPLRYVPSEQEMTCSFCHRTCLSNADCENGHFICDACHSAQGIAVIRSLCLDSQGRDPLALAQKIMQQPVIYMHGPEHHVLVGAVLLTAYRNCGGTLSWPEALYEMIRRGQKVPGGVCGFWGCCGAAVSSGIFVSIVTESTPLSKESWGLSNQMTALALGRIGALGGPRCCKRDSFTALLAAVEFSAEHLGVRMDAPKEVLCDFSSENAQCLKKNCPYHRLRSGIHPADIQH